jgi:hypothetical protein
MYRYFGFFLGVTETHFSEPAMLVMALTLYIKFIDVVRAQFQLDELAVFVMAVSLTVQHIGGA